MTREARQRRRREVRRMLRAGLPRAAVERYLAGCLLIDALGALVWRAPKSPHTVFDRALVAHYADVARMLMRPSRVLFALLRHGKRITPTYGKWRRS